MTEIWSRLGSKEETPVILPEVSDRDGVPSRGLRDVSRGHRWATVTGSCVLEFATASLAQAYVLLRARH